MAEFKWSQSQNAKYQKKVINQKKKFSQYEADGKDTSKLKVYPDNPIRISRSAESTLEAYVNYRKALREQGLSLEPVVTGAAKVVRTPAEEWAAEKINARPAEEAIQGRAQMTGTKNPLLNVKGIDDLSKYRGKLVPLTSDQVENSAPLSFDSAKDTREYQWASRHPAIAAAVNIGMSPVAGLEGYLNEARSAAGDKKLDANEMRGALIQESLQQGIQKGVRDRLGMQDDGVLDKREQTANFLTGVGLSTVNSLVSAALMPEAAVLAAFSGNAANQALLDAARDENMSKTQATMSAAAQGIAEALFEKWSVENFKVMQAKPVTSIKELAKNLVKSMVGEGSEEFFTDAANDITDYMINGDNSAFMRNFRERVQNGEDPSQARMNALRDRFLSASQSFLAGAISGAGSAAVGSAIGTYTNGKSMQSLAENYAESHSNRNSGSGESYIRKSPKAQAGMYQEIADSIDDSTDEGRIARDAAQNAADRMNRGERLSTVQQGYVANAVDAAAANAAESSNDRDREANNGYGPKPESVPEDVWKEITKEPYNAMSRKARTQMQLAGLSEVERKRTAEKIRSLEQSALKEWGKNYGESGRSAFVENYNASGLNSDQYLKAFNSIYNAGRYGMKQNEMSSAYSALISDQDLFENIFKAGVKDRQRALDRIPKMGYQARQEQRVGGIRDAAPTISDNVKSVFESLGKKTGLEFVLLDSRMGNGISNNAMGSYSGDGVITIDVGNTENILATTSHEMTHWLEAYAPMEYQNFEEAAVRSIMRSKSTTIEKEIAIRRNSGYTGSDEDIIKEIVADSTGTFLNDENFAKEIAAKNHTIAERILDWLSSMIDAIKELISDKGIRSSAKALQEDLENYQKIRETWIGAVEQASEKMKSIELVDGDLDSESIDRTGERFQRKLKESGIDAEVTDSLVAIHNIRPDSMMKILNYSGIPMPSIAVTKAEMGWDKFGEISMVFRRNTIDPAANKKNKVYRGDSWTPTFPKVDYDVDEGVYQSVQKKVASLMEGKEPSFLTQEAKHFIETQIGNAESEGMDGVVSAAKYNDGMRAAFLASKGVTVSDRMRTVERPAVNPINAAIYQGMQKVFSKEEIEDISTALEEGKSLGEIKVQYGERLQQGLREAAAFASDTDGKSLLKRAEDLNKKAFVFRNTILKAAKSYDYDGGKTITETVRDMAAIGREIDSKIDEKEYESWIRELYSGLIKGTGVWNGKDPLTASGNRRSFKQTHYEVTPENIVKSMLTQGDDKNIASFTGIKTVHAAAMDTFRSIAEMHKQERMLQDIDTAEYKAQMEELSDRLVRVIYKITDTDDWMMHNAAGDVIMESAERAGDATAQSVMRTFKKYDVYKVTEQDAAEIADIINEVKYTPVEMFEAKPERVVGWSEIGYVLVPEGTAPELLDKMGERGLETITYDPEIKGDRTEKLKSLEGVRFQLDLDESSPVSMDFLGDKMQGAKQELVSLMEEARGIRPSEASISRLVSGMIKDYHSEADPLYIKNQIMKFYDYMSLHEGIKNEDFGAVAASIGGEIIENATMINEEAEAQWKSFKKDLRSRQIYISPHNVKDVDPEGLSHLNRRFFGKIRFTTDPELMHQDAHTAYSTLHEVYPDILPEDPYGMFDDEAIRLIIDARENGAPLRQRDVPTEAADFNEAAYELGERILNTYFKAASPSLLRSYQETYQKAVKSMQKDISFELAKYRKKLESEVNRKLNLLKKQYAENMYDFREYQMEKGKLEKALEKANLNAAAVRERIRQKNQDYIKRQKKANEIKRIESSMRKIQRMIEQPTNRAHVPAPIAKGIQQLFSVIDLTTDMSGKSDVLRQQDYRRLQNLNFENALQDFKNIVRAVNENGGALVDSETHLTTYITLDPDFLSRLENMERYIESMAKTYKGIPKVRKMSYEQIHELSQLISYIRHFLDYANRFTSMDIDETIGVFAERTFSDLRERTAPKTYDSKTAPMRSFFQKMAQEGMLDSPTFFNLIGPSGDRIYNTLRAGLNKKTVSMDKSMRYIDEMMSEFGVDTKDFRKWDTKVREITIHGKKVKVTDAQIMELYVLNHREQARKHIYGNKENMDSTRVNGGIQFSGVGVKGILEKVQAPIGYLTGSNIESIISILTPQQKQVAESMQRFLSGYMSQLGNETSMNLYGYEKFTESNYWPIHTMSEFRDTRTTDIEKGMTTLENMGWTKTITQKAQNPLKIGSIFDTFVEHVDKMTSYNAYLPGLTDLRKWFNYQDAYMSMKSKLAEHMGENALEYINHLILDLNGSRGRADSWGMFSENLVSRAKGVAVAANPSVWIQQPFSIVRAAAEIDPKYILQALEPAQLAKRKEEWKNCREYAPIAKWKEFGGPDIGTGQSVKQLLFGNANKIEDFREFSMKPAEMGDRLTWCTLWMAAENQVRAEQKRLSPGTSEFYQAAAKIFDHVIDFTQVVDSPLHRTEMMKSKNPIAQLATAFQSEPQKTYDMLYREVYKAKQGDAEARKRIYTTILILACNIIATNAGKALAQALKDKDKDKRYGERWRDAFLSDIGVGGIVEALDPESDAAVQERIGGAVSGYALSDMSPLSYFPYIKDVLETFINNISGKGYRDSDLSNQNLTDLITGAKALLDLASGDTKKGVMGTAYAASSAAHIKGIPLKNAMRYVGAAIDEMLYAIDTDATRRLRYKRNQLMLNEGNESNVQQFIREALKSYAAGDAALGDKIISDLLEHGIDEEKLESRMASMLSKEPEFAEAAEAKAGRNDGVYQDARKMLLDKGYSEELVDSKLESRVKSEIRKNAPYTGTEIAEILYQQQEGYQNSLQQYSDYLKEHYGKTDKEIRASLKGSLTNQYKPLYEKASTAEKSEIMRNLYRIRYKGKQLYETKDFQRWNKK